MGNQRGFNLVELAIVIVIVGLLIGGLVTPLSTQQDIAKRAHTGNQLQEIHDALLGYAARTGRLPCPATATSAGESSPSLATNACTSYNGFVPARTLDLDGSFDNNSLLLDDWLNPVRYSLTSASGGAFSNTLTLALVPDLQICAESACTTVLANTAVAVVYSTGEDGTTTTSADQLENMDDDNVFVTRTISEATGAEFDDQVVWMSPNTLVFQLVRAGRVN
ncbi:MAG: type II secretion system protein [Pseudomonadales bacterium]|nr:type II secretion system protein [Pseudomonadales bacterium]MBO6823717.1 type II secretion system protein [Pseudomonadales bacterium]